MIGVKRNPFFGDAKPPDSRDTSDWLVAIANTLRADMHNDKLYPPGTVYIMVCDPPFNREGSIVEVAGGA